jgi:hypothetical protein
MDVIGFLYVSLGSSTVQLACACSEAQMMTDQVRKWLRQQSKYFYAAGFDALVKRWDKCINVGGVYVEK